MKRIGDYRKLRKHFIPRRAILFVKGKAKYVGAGGKGAERS